MTLESPFRLGQFLVDADGRLRPGTVDASPVLHMRWRGLAVQARLDAGPPQAATGPDDAQAADPAGRLALAALVGRVPSTAGAPDRPARRARVLAALAALRGELGVGWRLRLLPDHRACIEEARPIALPATAAGLLTEITCFLLALAPYLDVLAEPDCAVEPVAVPASLGMANT